MVLALPRGGVPVAYEIARKLGVPLDVYMVRKLGAPFNPELAIGALASGDLEVLNNALITQLGLSAADIEPVRARARGELERRERLYRGDTPLPSLESKTVVLVDDGIATGATMRAAVDAVRLLGPRSIVVAVPHAAQDSADRIATSADQVVALSTPEPYMAVGAWYQSFPQVSDDEVIELLSRARGAPAPDG